MCGIFGYVAKDNRPVDLGTLRDIARVTQSRGPHAWGLAWVTPGGKLMNYKQAGDIIDSLGLLGMARGSRMLIGHCRYATHGRPEDNTNNHPHDAGGDAWVVHNGVIWHYQQLVEQHGLRMTTDCDSEVLGLMIAKFRGKPMARAKRAAEQAMGRSPFAMMTLWPDRLVATRANGQPLHISETRYGYWIASLPQSLPGIVRQFGEREILEFA
jgi:glucosamine 6-phosphate synthetase-like amidotransferase/phosphosugar isomerase protein